MSYTRATIKLDCKSVVDSMGSDDLPNYEYGSILARCTSIITQNTNFRIIFIGRQANQVVHHLTRASMHYTSIHHFNYVPSCIMNSLWNEMS